MQSLLSQLQIPKVPPEWKDRLRAGFGSLPLPTSSAALPIGLDIADGVARLLQLETTPDGLAISGATAQPFNCVGEGCDEWRAAKSAVTAGLAEPTMNGRRVVVSMPRSLVKYKAIRLGAAQTPAERANVFAEEAKSAFGVELSSGDFIVHFLESEALRRPEQVEGTLVIVRRTDVAEFVSELTAWGAEVVAVELEPISLLRTVNRFGKREEDAREANVLIDIGSRATRVVIGRGPRVSFFKSIPIGGRTIAAAAASALGLDEREAELLLRCDRQREDLEISENLVSRSIRNVLRVVAADLARELTLCIRYHSVTFQGRPPRVGHVTGGGATPLLMEHLQASLDALLPIRLATRDPLQIMACPAPCDAIGDRPLVWGKAFGLALQPIAAGAMDRSRTGATRTEQAEAELPIANTPATGVAA